MIIADRWFTTANWRNWDPSAIHTQQGERVGNVSHRDDGQVPGERERLGRKKGKMGKEFTSRNIFFLFAVFFRSLPISWLFFLLMLRLLSRFVCTIRRRWGTVKFRKMIHSIIPTLLYTCTNFSSSSFDGLAIVWRGSYPLCCAILRSVLDTNSSGRSTPQELKLFMLNSLSFHLLSQLMHPRYVKSRRGSHPSWRIFIADENCFKVTSFAAE